MKIGVLTYHCVPNFGAQLQATSTVGYLKRNGYEAVVLNWYPKDLEKMYAKRIPAKQIEIHNAYASSNLPMTDICRTQDELLHEIEKNELDAIIVGSDALFKYVPLKIRKQFSKRKLKYVTKDITSVEKLEGNPFFGGFVVGLKKRIPIVAFSVSSQNCPFFEMTRKEKYEMKKTMSHYSSITVRDEWTKGMVEDVLGISNVLITPDPVFSFNQNCKQLIPTKEEIIKKFKLQENYILFSFSTWYVKDDYIHSLAVEAGGRGYQPVAFPMPEGLNSADIDIKIQLPLDPIEWYALIKYSSGYIGERMHPIVVCLHNAVPFFSFDEYGTFKKSLFGFRKKYLQSSSKTYRILEKSGFTGFLFSYKQDSILPSAGNVIDMIERFDKKRCSSFSSDYQLQYENGMRELLHLFK